MSETKKEYSLNLVGSFTNTDKVNKSYIILKDPQGKEGKFEILPGHTVGLFTKDIKKDKLTVPYLTGELHSECQKK
jgi:hypothetical protein